MLSFIAALYNEEKEVEDLLDHVQPYVDEIIVVDDGSTDETYNLAFSWMQNHDTPSDLWKIKHIGRPETVKQIALLHTNHDWVLMLDADERFADGVLHDIQEFLDSDIAHDITHVWFGLEEFIDNQFTKGFAKCRLFRRDAVTFSTGIHQSDQFAGQGASFDWRVIHRKTSEKQIAREMEYVRTYYEMLKAGEITEEDMQWLMSNHYFVRVLHG